MLNIAVKAARKAGTLINRASLDIDRVRISQKDENDFVTEVDEACERVIIETLAQSFPSHGFLGEESGLTSGATGEVNQDNPPEFIWVIDPLDGTTNFIHGMPVYAVSIALMHKGQITQAVVFDPSRNDLFIASKGKGAFLNDRRLRVSRQDRIEGALIGTGFPFKRLEHMDPYLAMFKEISSKAAGLRRPGAAAIDLAYVAAGRYDAFFELGLMPWDAAAGSLLITEAGGFVGNFQGDSDYLFAENIVAGSPKVFAQMVNLLSSYKLPASDLAQRLRPAGH